MLIVTGELLLEPTPAGEHHLLSSPGVGSRHVCSGEGIPRAKGVTYSCIDPVLWTGFSVGVYPYTLTLAGRNAPSLRLGPAVSGWGHIQTPMPAEVWEEHVVGHPDRAYSRCLTEGVWAGFSIGLQYGDVVYRSASSNMQSASLHPEEVSGFLSSELRAGRVYGPVGPELLPALHINRFGLVGSGLCMYLSFPRGASVNDGIEPDVCSVHYTSVDAACRRVVALGRGTILAKFDVQGAFRTVPVHPEDRWLLGMKWYDEVNVDKVLPFALSSAPKVYNAVADALLWMLSRIDGIDGMNYLDDFLLFGKPDSSQFAAALRQDLARCMTLGVSMAPGKAEGPDTRLVFRGIKINMVSMSVCLPPPKLARL